jgi:putative ABC transport system substrate-binding protein
VKRRHAAGLVAVVACGAVGLPRAQPQRQARLGLLGGFGPTSAVAAPLWAALHAELAARGWHERRNLQIDGRYNEGRPERDAALAAELAALPLHAIVASNSGAVTAVRGATRTIPIVMVNVSHAVEAGFVSSLARPGGNVTGVTNQAGDMQGKFVELLRVVRPDLTRLGVFWSPGNTGSALSFKDAEAAAAGLGLRVVSLPVDQAGDMDLALSAARREDVQAVHVHPTPAVGGSWRRIMAWANEHRVVTLGQAAWVREGFLLSYWASLPDLYRIAAGLVDRILRGASPADLPVQQPTRFELTINLKTARALGLAVPQALLLRADEVIQ